MKIFQFLRKLIKVIFYIIAASILYLVLDFYFKNMEFFNTNFERTFIFSMLVSFAILVGKSIFTLLFGPIIHLKKLSETSEETIEKENRRVLKGDYIFSFMIKPGGFLVPIMLYFWYVLLIYLSPFSLNQSSVDETILGSVIFFSTYSFIMKYNSKLRNRFIKRMQGILSSNDNIQAAMSTQHEFNCFWFVIVLSILSFFIKIWAISYFLINIVLNQKISIASIILMLSFQRFSDYLQKFRYKY